MSVEQLAPPPVAQRHSPLRGANDIREHDRGQDPIRLWPAAGTCEELLDLVKDGIGVADPREMVGSRQLHVLRALNAFRDVSSPLHAAHPIALALDDERWDTNDGKRVPRVVFVVHAKQCLDAGRTHGEALEASPRSPKRLVVRVAGSEVVRAQGAGAPGFLDPFQKRPQRLSRHANRVVGSPQHSRIGSVEHERGGSSRIGGREHQGHWTTLGYSEERGLLSACAVHHRPDIIHPLLEGG
jgi:hypothetical protein